MSDARSAAQNSAKSGRLAFAVWVVLALLTCLAIFAGVLAYLNRTLLDERLLDLGFPPSSAELVASRVAGALADEVEFLRLAVAEGDLRLALEERNGLYRGSDEVVRCIVSEVDAAWRTAFASAVAPPRPIADNEGARALRRYSRLRPAIEVALIVDRYGAATASSEVLGQYDFSSEGWFRNTLATGQSAIVPSADVAFALVLPMPGNAPSPRGVFWAELDPSVLVANAVAELAPLGLSVAVVGRSGRLVYPVSGSGMPLPDSVLLEAAGRDLAAPARLDTSSGAVVAMTAGVPDRGFVDVGADLGWTVLVWRPVAEMAEANTSWLEDRLRTIWIALGAAGLLALLAAWVLSRPLLRLRRVAQAAEAGSEVLHPSRTGVPFVRSGGLASLAALARRSQELEIEGVQLRRGLTQWLESAGVDPTSSTDGEASSAELLARAQREQERRRQALERLATEADRLARGDEAPDEVRRLAGLLAEAKERLDELSRYSRRLTEGRVGPSGAVRADLQALLETTASSAIARTDNEVAALSAGVSRAAELTDRIGVLALNASIKAAMVGTGSSELGEIVGEIEDLGRHARENLAESVEILDQWLQQQGGTGPSSFEGFDALQAALEQTETLEESARDPLAAGEAAREALAQARGELERLQNLAGDHLWVPVDVAERVRRLLDEASRGAEPLTGSSSAEVGDEVEAGD